MTKLLSDIQWTADEKKQLCEAAKIIYANNHLDGNSPSKLQSFREAVTLLPPERQKEIPSLSHIRYWTAEYWPANTEPLDVIERLRNERAAAAETRTQVVFTEPEVPAETASVAVAEQPVETAPAVTEVPKETAAPEQTSFWTRPMLETHEEPLFDEAALAAKAAANVAQAAAAVPVTHKKSRTPSPELLESPEAQITKGLTALLAERINTVVDKRTAVLFEAKTKTFVEEALSTKLNEFRDDMTIIAMTIEESVTKAISGMEERIYARLAQGAPITTDRTSSSQQSEANTVPLQNGSSQDSAEFATRNNVPAVKPNILILGAADGSVQHIKHRFGRMVELEVYTGPNNDKKSPGTLMDQPGLDAILVSGKYSSLTIVDALQHRKHLQPIIHKVSGSISSMQPVIEEIVARKQSEASK